MEESPITSPAGDVSGACVRRSRALPFTEAGLKRAIGAARKAGLRVTAIRPDGTLEVDDSGGPQAALDLGHEVIL